MCSYSLAGGLRERAFGELLARSPALLAGSVFWRCRGYRSESRKAQPPDESAHACLCDTYVSTLHSDLRADLECSPRDLRRVHCKHKHFDAGRVEVEEAVVLGCRLRRFSRRLGIYLVRTTRSEERRVGKECR